MVTKKDWLKVIVLILVPVNVWLGVLYYLHWQKRGRGELVETFRFNTVVRVTHFAEKWGIKEGQQLVYPFPVGNTPTLFLGVSPPVGQGRPVLFLNICRITSEEVWRPALQEALASSPFLRCRFFAFLPTSQPSLPPSPNPQVRFWQILVGAETHKPKQLRLLR